ncbi:MAG TPA: hypothetical protein VK518_05105, partial [Puia sp.]|nr:hypothetical protein [Puia sp.]
MLMRPNASVEELIGRLPGLRIDADGTITFNGEKITQLLVDGEDLFASDPTLVTRSFDASKIARIQLLDRKSDQTRFSGIDDGRRTKTLNLVLKDDSKKGYFGKVEAGTNTQENYNATGLLASFKNREQIAALGLASNIGVTGFNTNSGSSAVGISSLNAIPDPMGASAGRGIPRMLATGLHYANTWKENDDHLVGNYQYGNLLTRPVTSSTTIQALPDSLYVQNRSARSINQQNQHLGYSTFDFLGDKSSSLQIGFRYNNAD